MPDVKIHASERIAHAPCHQKGQEGVGTAATVKRTSLQLVILERVYAERDITNTAKTNCEIRRGNAHDVLPIVG
jgi:hypothetical protein